MRNETDMVYSFLLQPALVTYMGSLSLLHKLIQHLTLMQRELFKQSCFGKRLRTRLTYPESEISDDGLCSEIERWMISNDLENPRYN